MFSVVTCNAHSKCIDLLRLQANQTFSQKKLDAIYKIKRMVFKKRISKFGHKNQIILSKHGDRQKLIQKVIDTKFYGYEISSALETVSNAINDPNIINEWIENLHQDILIETLILKKSDIYQLTLPYDVTIKVIISRARKVGFQGVITPTQTLRFDEFALALKSKYLILDNTFIGKDHGELIHMLHVDLMIYAIQRANQDPRLSTLLYEWIGERHENEFEGIETRFDSLKVVWGGLFDSYQNDWTAPEKLNPLLVRYLNLEIKP